MEGSAQLGLTRFLSRMDNSSLVRKMRDSAVLAGPLASAGFDAARQRSSTSIHPGFSHGTDRLSFGASC
jgi:hypothetical protein